jgi:tetratricopeptide (TPR) repeat protein
VEGRRRKIENALRIVLPSILLVFIFVALLGVRRYGLVPPPDPNDPEDVGLVDAQVLGRSLKYASDFINSRRARREISDAQGQQLLSNYAAQLVDHVDTAAIQPADAYLYGDLFRTARRWDVAEQIYEKAVEWANHRKSEDRRVNDTLRLAQAKAQLGKLDEALKLARSTFDAAPKDKAPILMSVLYEVVPAATGKGRDLELARLLEAAIDQHYQVQVDPQTEAGGLFLTSRSFHIGRAWQTARALYRSAGREDLAQSIPERMQAMTERHANKNAL